jgi:hypothetical protein
MGRIVTVILALAALAAPAALADKPTRQNQQNAAQQCKAQLQKMGTKDFKALWKNLGQCVALTAQQDQDNVTSAEEQCRADRAKDADAFATKWGKSKNAFGKCVSQTAKGMAQQQQQATLNAAQTCKAERAKDAAAFRTTYGHGKGNAFAQCVAQHKKK